MTEAAPPGTPLARALIDAGMSQRELARRLAGPDATEKQVQSRRRAVGRWCRGEVNMGAKSAGLVAAVLGVPADRFVTPRVSRASLAEEVRQLQEAMARLEKRLDALVAAVENQGEKRGSR